MRVRRRGALQVAAWAAKASKDAKGRAVGEQREVQAAAVVVARGLAEVHARQCVCTVRRTYEAEACGSSVPNSQYTQCG